MTRDQLIERRRRKKRSRRIAAGAAVVAVGLIAFSVAGIMRSYTENKPGDMGTSELSEVDGIISVPEDVELLSGPESEESAESTVSGWSYTEDGTFYYEDGAPITGLVEISGSLYYFGYDGVLLTGWQEDDGKQYYFSPEDGKALKGEQTIGDKKYFFGDDGALDPAKTANLTAGAGMVALTYDDGPGYYTDALLDLLVENDAKATFFMIGSEVVNYPSAVLREYELGMEQGNHSWDHKTLTHLSDEEIVEEFQKTNDAITSITGGEIRLFRAPGGGINDAVFNNSLGMYSILWTIDTLDWETKNAQQTYDTVINNVKDGDIILMHEIYEASLDASRMLIPKLKEMGYQLVTVSELAAAKGVTLETGVSYGAF